MLRDYTVPCQMTDVKLCQARFATVQIASLVVCFFPLCIMGLYIYKGLQILLHLVPVLLGVSRWSCLGDHQAQNDSLCEISCIALLFLCALGWFLFVHAYLDISSLLLFSEWHLIVSISNFSSKLLYKG